MRFLKEPELNAQGKYEVEVSSDEALYDLTERMGVAICFAANGKVILNAPNPGLAMLFMVRDTFKSTFMCVIYSVFLLAAAFHAFNGVWTAMITWGAILSYRSQRAMLPVGWIGALALSLLGLAAIWGSYWI
jgi:succinate dehydrogenase/fumarate reductase cytochrome b subunit